MFRVTRGCSVFTLSLALFCYVTGCGPDSSPSSGAAPAPPAATPVAEAPQRGADDPQLPELLKLELDPADPNRLLLTFVPSISGHARLTLSGIYNGNPSTELELKQMDVKKGDSPQSLTFSIGLLKTVKNENPDAVRVGLVLTDPQGQTLLTTHQELALAPLKSAPAAVAPTSGTTAEGQPLLGFTPPSAPVPQLDNANREQ